MPDITDLKSNLEWALIYQKVLEVFLDVNVASYSSGGTTFTRNRIEFYQQEYEKYAALARTDAAGSGCAAVVDFRSH